MEAASWQKMAPAGDLVLQTGRQAGARRPLNAPATLIGRGPGCDLRLNVDGVDAVQCVLVLSAEGVHLRDLNSMHGTLVNGERVSYALMRHSDLLQIGPFAFRLELPTVAASNEALPQN